MPIMLIEAPAGADGERKRKLMREVTDAIEEAYHFQDVRIWLREYATENFAQDGVIGAEPARPVCFLEAPELHSLDARRKMSNKIQAAVAAAYAGLANTEETLIMMNHYPLEMAGFAGRLQSDNPQVVGALQQLNS